MGSRRRRVLNQSTHSRVANSTASRLRHGPRRWMTSVLYGLGEGVVVAVADAADRGDEARLDQALGVLDRDVLLVFNGLSQHLCALPVAPGRVPRQVFASQASCAACCSELLPPPEGRPLRACSGPSPSGSTVAAA